MARLDDILARQRAAFSAELPVSARTRRDRLTRLGRMIADNAERLAEAISGDYGHRSRTQTMMVDIASSLMAIDHDLAHFERWMRPERRKVPFPMGLLGARARIYYQPKGVVGVVSPWNFPVQLTIGPISGAFAAGNRVMVKPSEVTPRTSALLETIVAGTFDEEELAVVCGGPDVAQAFTALPFDHLLFTGGTGVGRHVLRAAAENLVPTTLELGGKSPAIISRSADMATATRRIAFGKMTNAGQICLAPDYVLVARDQEAAFVEGTRAAVAAMYPMLLANDDYTSIINDRHHARIEGYLSDAREKGAEIVEINPGNEDFAASNTRKMPLRLILNASDDMDVMREEIFGPVLPVRSYERIEEAIDYVNAHDRPLGFYVFGTDDGEIAQVLEHTIAGGVTVNDVLFHVGVPDLPFGGIGPSGMGAYHGIDGFRTFSHAKSVFRQGWLDFAKLGGMAAPYGKNSAQMIERSLKSWRTR